MNNDPEFMRITNWCAITGMSRTAVYRAIVRGDLKTIKLGKATLVDAKHGLAWMRSLPPADIKLSSYQVAA